MKKNIVVFGGGNGSATTLRALKRDVDSYSISAVIAMSDSGGSSGKLRMEFQTLPAGDIMRAVLSLSPYPYKKILRQIFHKKRFTDVGPLTGHNIGNIFLVLAAEYTGNFMHGVRALEQALEAQGTVYPATQQQTDLVATLSNGETITGEAALDEPTYDRAHTIQKVWLEPAATADPDALAAIRAADHIILGPGSLYTSVIASLLPSGIYEAISESKAKLLYIAGNKYEVNGETGPTELCGFVAALEQYLPRKIDTVLFNGSQLTPVQKEHYKEKGWGVLQYIPEHLSEYEVYDAPFESEAGGLDSKKLADILRPILT